MLMVRALWRAGARVFVGPWVLLGLIATVACHARPASTPPATPVPLEIRVEQRADDQWSVEYRFAPPVDRVRFLTRGDGFRANQWTLVQAWAPDGAAVAVQWARAGEHEVVLPVDPQARLASLTVRFESDLESPAKDYALNHAFSDGGRVLYVGHLMVAAGAAKTCTWQVRTQPGRYIASPGGTSRGTLSWEQPCAGPDDGAYVYFGDQAPVEGPYISSIVDPQLPKWLRRQTGSLIPQLMDHFTHTLGIELDFHPLVLLSYGGASEPGRRFVGGTAARGLQAAVSGAGWSHEDHEAQAAWCTTLAHELFHLWNGEMFRLRSADPSEEWLTEGSADYFALFAAEAVGCLSPAEVRTRLVETANACMARRHGRPLAYAPHEGDFESLYVCGAVMLSMVDAELRRRSPAVGLPQVFARMFQAASKCEGPPVYGTFDLLEAIHALTPEVAAVAPVERLLHVGVDGSVELYFRDAMRAAGLDVELVPPREATLRPRDVGDMLRAHLARCRCPSLPVDPSRCGEDVVAVAGVTLTAVPAAALDELAQRTRRGDPIELETSRGRVTLECPAPASPEHGMMLKLRE
jgi:hypothetical protein